MITKIIANKVVRKLTVFVMVFLATGFIMSGRLVKSPGTTGTGDAATTVDTPDIIPVPVSAMVAVPAYGVPADNKPGEAVKLGDMDYGMSTLSDMIKPVVISLDGTPDNGYLSGNEDDSFDDDEHMGNGYFEGESDNIGNPDGLKFGNAMPKTEAEAEKEEIDKDFVYCDKIPLSEKLQLFTYEKCQEQNIEYSLVLALMWRESRFKENATHINSNGTKDSGIMQINDVNRSWLKRELGITDLLDPYQNITAGTTMLGRLTEKYGAHDALMAYQYGEQGMKDRMARGITTNNSIQQLYVNQSEFQKLLDDAK